MVKKNIKTIVTSLLVLGLASVSTFLMVENLRLTRELNEANEHIAIDHQEINKYMTELETDTLSKWDIFTLALMKVESDYDITAKSSVGARGYFQLMPIYVKEVNRVHKTNYKYEEVVKSFDQSYEVFMLMQKAHNKNFNIDKALVLHNGNHKWYHKRVYDEKKKIERYEEMRKMIKNTHTMNI